MTKFKRSVQFNQALSITRKKSKRANSNAQHHKKQKSKELQVTVYFPVDLSKAVGLILRVPDDDCVQTC
jgi:hypothetical protein